MRIKTLFTLAALGLFAGTITSSDAFAKKEKTEETASAMTIEQTGVASLDEYFGKVQALCDRLTKAREGMDAANKNLTTVLGLATDAPIATALADLNEKAGGAIAVAMEGTKPKLTVSDAVPENVQAAIDAVNDMVEKLTAASTEVVAVSTEAAPLAKEAPDVVKRAPTEIKDAGTKATEIPKILKTVKNNAAATTALPEEAKALTTSITDTLEIIKTTFSK